MSRYRVRQGEIYVVSRGVWPLWHEGNFDGDDDIDITDFNFLASNFAPGSYGASAVPEPSSLLLTLLGLILFAGLRGQQLLSSLSVGVEFPLNFTYPTPCNGGCAILTGRRLTKGIDYETSSGNVADVDARIGGLW